MRVIGMLSALGHVALALVTTWALLFVSTFRFENQSEASHDALAWLTPAGLVVFAVAIALVVCVALERRRLSWSLAAGQLVAGAIILVWALGQSVHSDGALVAFGAAFLATAAVGAASVRVRQGEHAVGA